MNKIAVLLLAILSVGLSSCSTYTPSAEYQQCKSALVGSIAQDLKEGAE